MDAVIGELPTIVTAFRVTLELTLLSAMGALVLGTITAIMYISSVPPLRYVAATYVRFVRNTPVTVVFFLAVFGLPQVGITLSFYAFALIALIVYTATFVAETIRSGVQAIPVGQFEAARSLGMSFSQIMRTVVLPQAMRAVIPPMASLLIALLKNSSIASAFGVTEAIGSMTSLVNVYSSSVLWFMAAVALGYVLLAAIVGSVFAWIERKAVVVR